MRFMGTVGLKMGCRGVINRRLRIWMLRLLRRLMGLIGEYGREMVWCGGKGGVVCVGSVMIAWDRVWDAEEWNGFC